MFSSSSFSHSFHFFPPTESPSWWSDVWTAETPILQWYVNITRYCNKVACKSLGKSLQFGKWGENFLLNQQWETHILIHSSMSFNTCALNTWHQWSHPSWTTLYLILLLTLRPLVEPPGGSTKWSWMQPCASLCSLDWFVPSCTAIQILHFPSGTKSQSKGSHKRNQWLWFCLSHVCCLHFRHSSLHQQTLLYKVFFK